MEIISGSEEEMGKQIVGVGRRCDTSGEQKATSAAGASSLQTKPNVEKGETEEQDIKELESSSELNILKVVQKQASPFGVMEKEIEVENQVANKITSQQEPSLLHNTGFKDLKSASSPTAYAFVPTTAVNKITRGLRRSEMEWEAKAAARQERAAARQNQQFTAATRRYGEEAVAEIATETQAMKNDQPKDLESGDFSIPDVVHHLAAVANNEEPGGLVLDQDQLHDDDFNNHHQSSWDEHHHVVTAFKVENEDSTQRNMEEIEEEMRQKIIRESVSARFVTMVTPEPKGPNDIGGSSSSTTKIVMRLILAALALPMVAVAVTLGVTLSDDDSGDTRSNNGGVVSPIANGKAKTGTALIVAATQDCFVEREVSSTLKDGSLVVSDTASLIPVINKVRTEKGCLFDVVVRTMDYHPRKHISFASTHGLPAFAHNPVESGGLGKGPLPIMCTTTLQTASCCPTYWVEGPGSQNCSKVLCPIEENIPPDTLEHTLDSPACDLCRGSPHRCFRSYQAMWPDHCIQGEESGIPPKLFTRQDDIVLNKGDMDYVDSYSEFMDNTRNIISPLASILQSHGIHTVYLVGLTTDFGIKYSASHARILGYNTKVILDATRYIGEDSYIEAVEQMREEGVDLINSEDLMEVECPGVN